MNFPQKTKIDLVLFICIIILVVVSNAVLRSLSPDLYPTYFVFVAFSVVLFLIFAKIEFEVLTAFSKHFYYFSIFLLILPLVIGQVTRGVIRWIPIGSFTLQPSEIVRPFLFLYIANYLTQAELDVKRIIKALLLMVLPIFLIVIQPSLGVSVLTAAGFLGVVLSSGINKKYIAVSFLAALLFLPILWLIMAPYQKQRVVAFMDPYSDPHGVGYNSIQSMISLGSGKLGGRGLGKGSQTQLEFLPEKHTDFVFAAVGEELGFVGSSIILLGLFLLLWRLTVLSANPKNPTGRAYFSGIFFAILVETLVHVGMNMGMLPITGVPLPLVSAGGSSLIATTVGLGLANSAGKTR